MSPVPSTPRRWLLLAAALLLFVLIPTVAKLDSTDEPAPHARAEELPRATRPREWTPAPHARAEELAREGHALEQQTFHTSGSLPTGSERREEILRKALRAYEESANLAPGLATPDRGTNLEAVGRIHSALREYQEAIPWLEMASETETPGMRHYACPYLALGNVYRALGDRERAYENLQQALSRKPSRRETHFFLAQYHVELGQPDEALVHARKASDLLDHRSDWRDDAPDLGEAPILALEGFIHVLLNDPDEAEKHFTQGLERRGPTTAFVAGMGHVALARHDLDGARSQLMLADTQAPERYLGPYMNRVWRDFEDDMRLLGLGWLEANEGQHERALPHFEAILATRPANSLALTSLANSLVWLGRLDEAEAAYQRLLTNEPEDPLALAGLGIVQLERGQPDQAERLLLAATQGSGTPRSCPYEGLGLLYLGQGRTDLARDSFQTAIDIAPEQDFRKYNGLARIHLTEGDRDRAAELVARSLANQPNNAEALELQHALEEGAPQSPAPTSTP